MRLSAGSVSCVCAWCVGVVEGSVGGVESRLVALMIWAFSSDGRAPASHAGGRGIDTPNVHSSCSRTVL